jgi:ABC-type transport system involved in cytochrome c biogenesis permease component
MATKAANTMKELIISIIGIIIAIILAVFALGVANWAIDVFNITDNLARAAALIAVAIVIGPAIAAFATKKYY